MKFDLLKMKNDENINKKLIAILTSLYLVLLIWIVVFKCNYNEGLFIEVNKSRSLLERLAYNTIPFDKFIEALRTGGTIAVTETLALVFNVICFIPFGGLACFLVDGKGTVVLYGAALSLAIEVYQLFSCWGGPDYMDVILNTIGVLLGVLMHGAIVPKLKERTLNALTFWTAVCLVPVDAFAIINSIIKFPGF